MWFCPRCGAQIMGQVNFCPNCGANFGMPQKRKAPWIVVVFGIAIAIFLFIQVFTKYRPFETINQKADRLGQEKQQDDAIKNDGTKGVWTDQRTGKSTTEIPPTDEIQAGYWVYTPPKFPQP